MVFNVESSNNYYLPSSHITILNLNKLFEPCDISQVLNYMNLLSLLIPCQYNVYKRGDTCYFQSSGVSCPSTLNLKFKKTICNPNPTASIYTSVYADDLI